MEFKFQKRKGIGNVITTLIILIASVVLGAGVIFFGGSMFQTNTGSESIKMSNTHIWVAQNGTASVGAFVVQNTGDKVISIERITIRGQSVPTSSWYYNNTNTATAQVAIAANIQKELVFDGTLGTIEVASNVAGEEAFSNAQGPISLSQGQAAFIFLANPAGIDSIDTGNNFTFQVQAGKATATESVAVVTE
ncbi:MAG: hypothetical protein AB1351_12955 [Thermoproteota archaeon]